MNEFNRRVYILVKQVPEGKVTTYGALAAALGDPRKAREVGWALRVMPDDVEAPAHRVINRTGRLSGGWAFGGPEVQRQLLEAEGVRFLADGSVDMAAHLWLPAAPEKAESEPTQQDRLL
ncbi:MAG: MGMT family protein [Chloroflexota bacterium]